MYVSGIYKRGAALIYSFGKRVRVCGYRQAGEYSGLRHGSWFPSSENRANCTFIIGVSREQSYRTANRKRRIGRSEPRELSNSSGVNRSRGALYSVLSVASRVLYVRRFKIWTRIKVALQATRNALILLDKRSFREAVWDIDRLFRLKGKTNFVSSINYLI